MKPISEIKINKSQINTLANNLHSLMNERGVTETELARFLNIPVMTIRRIASGETADPRISTLKIIADYFDVQIDYLINATYEQRKGLAQNQPCFIPIFDWKTASKLDSISNFDKSTWQNWHPMSPIRNQKIGSNTFALPSKTTMQPRFPLGTLFIIDADENPEDGDLVLLKFKNDDDISLRELIIDPPNRILQPVVQGSEPLAYEAQNHKILGVVILTLLYTRQN